MRPSDLQIGARVRIKEGTNIRNRIGDYPNLYGGAEGTITRIDSYNYGRDGRIVTIQFAPEIISYTIAVYTKDLQVNRLSI